MWALLGGLEHREGRGSIRVCVKNSESRVGQGTGHLGTKGKVREVGWSKAGRAQVWGQREKGRGLGQVLFVNWK